MDGLNRGEKINFMFGRKIKTLKSGILKTLGIISAFNALRKWKAYNFMGSQLDF